MTEEKPRMARGSVIKGYARYIKRRWGTDGVLACQKAIGKEGFEVKEDAWYPEHISHDIVKWIAEAHGEDYVVKAGAFTVTEVGVIAYAARLAGIRKVLERGKDDYSRNLNYGSIDIIDVGEKEATIILKDSSASKIACLSWKGVFTGILQLTNKKGSVEEVECELDGASGCKYIMKWE